MKCDKCGFVPNPGDQICINCGAKLSLKNVVIPEVEKVEAEEEKKDYKKLVLIVSGIIILAIILIVLIIKFLVLK